MLYTVLLSGLDYPDPRRDIQRAAYEMLREDASSSESEFD